MKHLLLLTAILSSVITSAQNKYDAQDIRNYIRQFKDKAIVEQMRSNVPASITLAQGILESGAGTSELSVNANNHFGIKCKRSWKGATYTYTDDRKDECFRKYEDAIASYENHSDFLTNNKRYSKLFTFDITDYKKWAHGLKKAGYATSPTYAQRLIKVVETYDLNQYTHEALNLKKKIANNYSEQLEVKKEKEVLKDTKTESTDYQSLNKKKEEDIVKKTNSHVVIEEQTKYTYYEKMKLHGIFGFYAKKGDYLLEQAIRNKIRYAKLLEINDLADEPLPYDCFIYLNNKNNTGARPNVTVGKDESLHYISQKEGIKLSVLKDLNLLNNNDKIQAGQVLNLKYKADKKPKIVTEKFDKTPKALNNSNKSTENFITKEEITTTEIQKVEIPIDEEKQAEIEIETVNLKEEKQAEVEIETVNLKEEKQAEVEIEIVNLKEEKQAEVEIETVNLKEEKQAEIEIEAVNLKEEKQAEETIIKPIQNVGEKKDLSEKSIEEKQSQVQETPPVPVKRKSALDRIKEKMDQSVYGPSDDYESYQKLRHRHKTPKPKATKRKKTKNLNKAAAPIRNRSSIQQKSNSNVSNALKKYMEEEKSKSKFKPKESGAENFK